jgi:hypothetical protein
MEDIIDIIVTETTNTIEITAQPNDEIIDVNIIDNREDIVLNVTPTVVEININSLTSNFGVEWGDITGTLADQTDLNNALALKANLVGGKVPASELPSYVDDVVEVATFSALPATGEIGKIYVILDTNKIYRWSGSVYVEIADSTAVWGAITGTLSSQTDLQNALNAKFDDPTGDTTQYIAGDGSLITFPVAGQSGTLVREVRNTTGATLTKGTIVYISGATGNKPTVSKAIATGDSTSAQTFGMCQANISNNSNGYVVCVGDLGGLDTSGLTEGAQLYLSSTTAGTYTTTKQLAPNHLVYIGVVTRAHPTQGQIEVNIQNGYELYELHDVSITSEANNDGLFYEASTDLWKNKSIATVLGYTPANAATYVPYTGATTNVDLGTNDLTSRYLTANGASALGGVLNLKQDATYLPKGNGFSSIASSFTAFDFYGYTGASTYKNFSLRFDGLTDNTLRTLTIPNASGTIALTSNLSAYLPLAGGTLTGALNGTSASLSSSITASALYVTGMTAGSGAIYHTASRLTFANYNTSGTLHFEVNGGAGALTLNADKSATFEAGGSFAGALSGTTATFSGRVTGNGGISSKGGYATFEYNSSATGPTYPAYDTYYGAIGTNFSNGGSELDIWNTVGGGFVFRRQTGASAQTALLTIASTGAATFSSSVTAGAITSSVASGNGSFYINNASLTNKNWTLIPSTSGAETDLLFFYTGAAAGTRMTLTNGGDLLVGLTSGARFSVRDGGGNDTHIGLGANYDNYITAGASGVTIFRNATNERMRITSGGATKMSTNGTYLSSTAGYHEMRQSVTTTNITLFTNTSASPFGIDVVYTAASPNNTTNNFIGLVDSTTLRFAVRSNGGVENYQANNVNLSDERTKKEISPLESYWNKFKALEIVKFKYKDQTHDDFNIGVIAQQVESVAPEFVDVDGWGETKNDEAPLKSVYSTDLYHASIGVLKEAMAKIETLEAKIATLENK